MDGGDWGFAEQTKISGVIPPPWLLLAHSDVNSRMSNAQAQQQRLRDAAVSAHRSYWDRTSPGQYFEHWRYEAGWNLGFSDMLSFFGMRVNGQLYGRGGDKVGLLDLWVRKRMMDSDQRNNFAWEFEQGFRRAVSDFYNTVGV